MKSKLSAPLLVGLLIGLLLVGGVVVLVNNRSKAPSRTELITNKDTGEQIYHEPNKTPETNGENRQVVLFGSDLLFDNGITDGQYLLVKESILAFSATRLQNKYESLTVIPKGAVYKDHVLTTQLRLGNTEEKLKIHISFSDLVNARVVIEDPKNTHGGTFDSGIMTVPPVTDGHD